MARLEHVATRRSQLDHPVNRSTGQLDFCFLALLLFLRSQRSTASTASTLLLLAAPPNPCLLLGRLRVAASVKI